MNSNTAPNLQPDDEKLQQLQEVQPQEVLPEEEYGETSGVFTSAPTLEQIRQISEAQQAFLEEIRRKDGYFERLVEAEHVARDIEANQGAEAAEKYLKGFEKAEAKRLKELAEKEGVEEKFAYEHAVKPLSPEQKAAREQRIGDYLEASLRETSKKTLEVLRPLELDVAEVLTRSGKDILAEKLPEPNKGIIESGGRKPVAMKANFKGNDVFAFSTPGLPNTHGHYAENRDGFVIMKTADGEGLQVVLSHGVSEGPEAAALTNTACVSVSHDLNKTRAPNLTTALERANDQVMGMKKELDVPKQRVAMLAATIKKASSEVPLYSIDVQNAGDAHCFVIEPFSGKVMKSTIATVRSRLDREKLPASKKNELLEKWATNANATKEQVERVLTMSAGVTDEFFAPVESGLTAAPGEIVVIASADFMRSVGGAEFFQDGAMGTMISRKLKEGKKLGDVLAGIVKNTMRRQKEGKLEDTPLSVIAFEVPGANKAAKTPKRQEATVDEILGKPLPLDLDLSDLQKE